ncbi:MAG: hypothetical protein SVM80_11225 [Halobacteriota archaeon]|nr:hypothetical protein [Halobacteriota archaeon]
MRKVYIFLVFMVLIFGMSSVLALEEPTEENVAVSGGGDGATGQVISAVSTPTEATSQMYVVNTELMKELDTLIKMLEEAEVSNDNETVEGLREKIFAIKEEIREGTEECEVSIAIPYSAGGGDGVPVTSSGGSGGGYGVASTTLYTKTCTYTWDSTPYLGQRIEIWASITDEKGNKDSYSISPLVVEENPWEMEGKDYPMSGKTLDLKIIEPKEGAITGNVKIEVYAQSPYKLNDMTLSFLGEDWNNSLTISNENCIESAGSVAISEAITPTEQNPVSVEKPVAVTSGSEITDYYKLKISSIMVKEISTDQQLKELKELRYEIDFLIEELIIGKDEINTEEVNELVTEIIVKPKEIKADDVVVNTINKTIAIKVNNKDLKIMPTETHVVIRDENLEIKAPELSIKYGVLAVGNSEVKLTASDFMEKIKLEPKELELKEENAKAVYKIKVEEDRKLLGFIPVEIEKELTADATNPETGIIEEETPWWAFLTTE